jgi:hypothetical protein
LQPKRKQKQRTTPPAGARLRANKHHASPK